MGRYTTRAITEKEFKQVIQTLKSGYIDHGIKRKPNLRVAMILELEANLGCRLSDIIQLRTNSIIFDGEIYRLDIVEKKTGKARTFIVPEPIREIINQYIRDNNINPGERLFEMTESAVWKCIQNVTKYLGLKDISTHSFRKFAAQRIYKASGNDLSLACQFLQHSSPATTQRYLKRSSKQMENAILKTALLV